MSHIPAETWEKHRPEVRASLEEALAYLREHGWVRRAWQNDFGVCPVAALIKVTSRRAWPVREHTHNLLTKKVQEISPYFGVMQYNDRDGATFEDIEYLFSLAIAEVS